MNKKAQFYLIAVAIIAVISIALLTVANSTKKQDNISLDELEKEIQIERENILDYIYINSVNADEYLINFSREFTNRIGSDKDVVFIFGNSLNITLIGNKLNNTIIKYNETDVDVNGSFQKSSPTIGNLLNLKLDENNFYFDFFEEKSIYYLVRYKYDDGVYIIYG